MPERPDKIKSQSVPRHKSKYAQFQHHSARFYFGGRRSESGIGQIKLPPNDFTARMCRAGAITFNSRIRQQRDRVEIASGYASCRAVPICRAVPECVDGFVKPIKARYRA